MLIKYVTSFNWIQKRVKPVNKKDECGSTVLLK
jgi:hypothetical protein